MSGERVVFELGHARVEGVLGECGHCGTPTLALNPPRVAAGCACPCHMARAYDLGRVKKPAADADDSGGDVAA